MSRNGTPPAGRTTIEDPAGRMTPEFTEALRQRYGESLAAAGSARIRLDFDDLATRFAFVCDLVAQILYPDQMGTGPDDPMFHTDEACRAIALAFFEAAGFEPERDIAARRSPRPGMLR